MTKFNRKSFTVASPHTEQYGTNYDAIFGVKTAAPTPPVPTMKQTTVLESATPLTLDELERFKTRFPWYAEGVSVLDAARLLATIEHLHRENARLAVECSEEFSK